MAARAGTMIVEHSTAWNLDKTDLDFEHKTLCTIFFRLGL
jgi:hypothetical protein